MAERELTSLSLAEVAAKIEQRDLSPVEVTEAVLRRIEALEPTLNAFVTVTADIALAAAREAEHEIVAGRYRGPLHGVPLSLKDLFATAGVRTTAGSKVLADWVPEQDATVTSRLHQAGTVLIGKCNMLEFAYGEVHPDYGPSRNPWHVEYGTSGSSSGSAAAVAAGLGYGTMGSDTGGSIRLPAAYCGIVGLKPTYGLISRAGVVPLSWSLDHAGPMTRTVRDCALLLQAVAGYDPADPTSANRPVPDYAAGLEASVRGLRVGVVEPEADDRVRPDVRTAVEAARAALETQGAELVSVRLPYPHDAPRALLAIMYPEASSYHLRWLRERPEDYSDNTRQRLELGALLPATTYLEGLRARQPIVTAYQELFRRVDLLLMPVGASASYRLDAAPSEPVRDQGDRMGPLIRFTGPFDLTGLPAISLPAGQTAEGLPIGVQLAARPFEEDLLLRASAAVEAALAGRLQPLPGSLVA